MQVGLASEGQVAETQQGEGRGGGSWRGGSSGVLTDLQGIKGSWEVLRLTPRAMGHGGGYLKFLWHLEHGRREWRGVAGRM